MTTPGGARVVTFGEMLLRLSPPRYERILEHGAFTANFGGCEANVAVALSKLGVRASYITRVPDNAVGDAAISALGAAGVDTRAVVRGGPRMGLYFVELGTNDRSTRVVYDRAHSAFSEVGANTFDWHSLLRDAAWLHVSGITPALGNGPQSALVAAIAAARASDVRVSIDLNYRPALWGTRAPFDVIEPLVRDTSLAIGNARAVREMLGVHAHDDATSTPESAHALARTIASRFGMQRVALTRREMPSEREHVWSASVYDATTNEFASSATHRVQVLDRVGGGDAFAAALLAAFIRERPLAEAIEFATMCGALKLGVPGDFSVASTDDIERGIATCT